MAETLQDVFLSDLVFARAYVSLHYPFTAEQLNQYIYYLDRGNAHYSVYVYKTDQPSITPPDISSSASLNEAVYSPQTGLCFNRNVLWEPGCKLHWTIGFWIPFIGVFEGIPNAPYTYGQMQEMEAKETLHTFIPLDLQTEFTVRDNCYREAASTVDNVDMAVLKDYLTDKELLQGQHYLVLSLAEFEALLEAKPDVVLFNDDIWHNTVRPVFTQEFMAQVMEAIILRLGPAKQTIERGYTCFAGLTISDPPHHNKAVEFDEGDLGKDYYDNEYYSKERFDKYNGYNDWSGQAIDEAFDGDPEATWNVD